MIKIARQCIQKAYKNELEEQRCMKFLYEQFQNLRNFFEEVYDLKKHFMTVPVCFGPHQHSILTATDRQNQQLSCAMSTLASDRRHLRTAMFTYICDIWEMFHLLSRMHAHYGFPKLSKEIETVQSRVRPWRNLLNHSKNMTISKYATDWNHLLQFLRKGDQVQDWFKMYFDWKN